MSKKAEKLHLFTAQFPYGSKSEPFLETEIIYLSKHFSEVIIYPAYIGKDNQIRPLPKNASLNESLTKIDYSKKNKVKALIKNLPLVFSILTNEVLNKGLISTVRNSKVLIDYLAQQILVKTTLKLQNIKFNDVVYSYWFVDSTLALTFLKKGKKIKKLVCRSHRFDLYDEEFGVSGVPFRAWTVKYVDKVFVISSTGVEYLKSKINSKYHFKILCSKLGVDKAESKFSQKPDSYSKIIVSCGGVTQRKQVLKTVDLLENIGIPVSWIHFGDGPLMNELIEKIKTLPTNVKVELKGHTDNEEVIDFYRNNKVDLFLSLSTSEGIPVSMMEAISFGIQIAAYPVGGIPEIVIPNKTGFLMNSNENEVDTIVNALTNPIEENIVKKFYSCNFNAEKNYTDFIEKICSFEK